MKSCRFLGKCDFVNGLHEDIRHATGGRACRKEGNKMPYSTNTDLPASIQRRLPPHAQDIYREAFNHAFAAHVGDRRQEEAAHRIAWAAVKRSYEKIADTWVGRESRY
jgi:cation transport regulator